MNGREMQGEIREAERNRKGRRGRVREGEGERGRERE